MANYFHLVDRATGHSPPLADIDAEICRKLNQPVDPVKYYKNWVSMIGIMLAFGKTWAEVREQWEDDLYLTAVIDVLEAKYDPHAWAER